MTGWDDAGDLSLGLITGLVIAVAKRERSILVSILTQIATRKITKFVEITEFTKITKICRNHTIHEK